MPRPKSRHESAIAACRQFHRMNRFRRGSAVIGVAHLADRIVAAALNSRILLNLPSNRCRSPSKSSARWRIYFGRHFMEKDPDRVDARGFRHPSFSLRPERTWWRFLRAFSGCLDAWPSRPFRTAESRFDANAVIIYHRSALSPCLTCHLCRSQVLIGAQASLTRQPLCSHALAGHVQLRSGFSTLQGSATHIEHFRVGDLFTFHLEESIHRLWVARWIGSRGGFARGRAVADCLSSPLGLRPA